MSFFERWFAEKKSIEKVSTAVLDRIFGAMREGVIVTDKETRILSSNQAAYEAFGRRNGALGGKRLSEVVRDLNLHEAFRKALDENASSDIELEIPGVEKRRYEARVAPIEFGETPHVIGIFYDVTQIERLETVRQEFLSNISHELRTPLTSILAFVETLEDGAMRDEANSGRFLGVIRKNAERMHRLIDDILELSTIESGKISFAAGKINLAALVEEVFVNLSGKAKERRVKLINEVAGDVFIRADPMRFEQMLTNLIDNAVKFNRDGGIVTVRHDRDGGKDTISVSDTGEGISAEHRERIFERFYRTDRARSREIGGTGLGLAIVKHLARLHAGEVSVSSTVGAGATFSIELPAESV